jgi:hypothetical protein
VFVIALAAFAIHKVFYTKRTLLELHEPGGVTIKVWAEPYRWVDEASILWDVSKNGKVILKHGFLDAHMNPIWPSCSALRSEDGAAIGIVNGRDPDAIRALYDLRSGFVWDFGLDHVKDGEKAQALVRKLQKPGTTSLLHLAP